MRSTRAFFAFFALLLCASMLLWAESGPLAVIEYSSGTDVVIIRAGKRLLVSDPIGTELIQGDQIQTGNGIFVEISMLRGGAVVKLAENTTFMLERLQDGQTSLLLVYGRVRAKVDKLSGTDTFAIRSSQAIAGVRGTDFGVDVVAAKAAASSSTVTKAYCFEGAVGVTTYVQPVAASEELEAVPKTYVIAAGQMAVVQETAAATVELTQSPVEEGITSFWSINEYVNETVAEIESIAEAPSETVPVQTAPAELTPAQGAPKEQASVVAQPAGPGYEEGYAAGFSAARESLGDTALAAGFIKPEELEAIRDRMLMQKAGLIAGGVLSLSGAATAITGMVLVQQGSTDTGLTLLQVGTIISASSVPFFLLTLIIKP